MKKIKFILMAFICAMCVGFVGCDKNEEESEIFGIPAGTPYSGELLGTWECVSIYNTVTKTLKSDGSVTWLVEEDGDWFEQYGLFYVQDNILAEVFYGCKLSSGETYDYNDYGGIFTEYSYIVSVTSDTLESNDFIGDDGDYDFNYAEDFLNDNYGGAISSGYDIYYKK